MTKNSNDALERITDRYDEMMHRIIELRDKGYLSAENTGYALLIHDEPPKESEKQKC